MQCSLTFSSADETPKCEHSNENGTVYYTVPGGFNFFESGWIKPIVRVEQYFPVVVYYVVQGGSNF